MRRISLVTTIVVAVVTISGSRVFAATSAKAGTVTNTCGSETTPIPWKYCVTQTAGSSNTNIVYYLHGGSGSELEWNSGQSGIQKAWSDNHVAPPTVVSISFGPKFLLVDKNSSVKSGMYQDFVNEVLPMIESKILKKTKSGVKPKRFLAGLSMGAFSVIELFTKNPELFDRAVLMCPFLINISPVAPASEIQALTSGWDPKWNFASLLDQEKDVIPDAASWTNSSPFNLAKAHLGPQTPPIYLSYGDRDAFVYGVREFEQIVHAKGAPMTTVVVQGEHCSFDDKGVAKFLSDTP